MAAPPVGTSFVIFIFHIQPPSDGHPADYPPLHFRHALPTSLLTEPSERLADAYHKFYVDTITPILQEHYTECFAWAPSLCDVCKKPKSALLPIPKNFLNVQEAPTVHVWVTAHCGSRLCERKIEYKFTVASEAEETLVDKAKELNYCGFCGKSKTDLQLCARCKVRAYCSKECQKKAWKVHKTFCVPKDKSTQKQLEAAETMLDLTNIQVKPTDPGLFPQDTPTKSRKATMADLMGTPVEGQKVKTQEVKEGSKGPSTRYEEMQEKAKGLQTKMGEIEVKMNELRVHVNEVETDEEAEDESEDRSEDEPVAETVAEETQGKEAEKTQEAEAENSQETEKEVE
ncbi:hypothetical protein K402DRAFT_424365 [Aulographum hederae CBS 113979]|uniref:MYND-type domain-containing protein n=1 Tax=Aulographum hederae CBS 113979 TaxID=1176131 RepID=A0A6G1GPD9_9PEZI|nr:hypothetical protein K402DRAFT_424365 [Aulographum hederae CBS 113979]